MTVGSCLLSLLFHWHPKCCCTKVLACVNREKSTFVMVRARVCKGLGFVMVMVRVCKRLGFVMVRVRVCKRLGFVMVRVRVCKGLGLGFVMG